MPPLPFSAKLKKLDTWLDRHCILWFCLFVMTLLRVPNFFEPYWYGDEGIYLTIGNAINHGQRLYADIVDHKTPLIYYLASVPNQLSFRILLYVWMLTATIAFYGILKKLLSSSVATILSLILFMILTTVPWLEGHIPNGELFVMGFVLVGGLMLLNRLHTIGLLAAKPQAQVYTAATQPKQLLFFFFTGTLLGCALLVKVPALFDAAAFFALFFFLYLKKVLPEFKSLSTWFKTLRSLVFIYLALGVGFILPLLLSILYFYSIGAGSDYLDFGLLYNFHYSGTWKLTFDSAFLTSLFTLSSKFIILLAIFLLLILLTPFLTPMYQFSLLWLGLTLFASLLSNRPYPHYFLQIIPPVSLVIGQNIETFVKIFQKMRSKKVSKSNLLTATAQLSMLAICLFLIHSVFSLLKVSFYSVSDYYRNWSHYATKRINKDEYYQRFNTISADNYSAAKMIADAGDRELFIWGTNPMLYALSETVPTGRFTVSFHIADLNTYDETFDDLVADAPTYIVVMHNESTAFPAFYSYLSAHYFTARDYDHFTLYRKKSLIIE